MSTPHLSIHLSICLFVSTPTYIYISIYLSIYLSICLWLVTGKRVFSRLVYSTLRRHIVLLGTVYECCACALHATCVKVLMQGKLFQRCAHVLYCSVLSLGGKLNTRRMSQPESIFTKIIIEIF